MSALLRMILTSRQGWMVVGACQRDHGRQREDARRQQRAGAAERIKPDGAEGRIRTNFQLEGDIALDVLVDTNETAHTQNAHHDPQPDQCSALWTQ